MFRPQLSIRQSTVLICSVTTAVYVNFLSPIFVHKAQAQNVFERVGKMFNGSRGEGNASGRSRGGATRSQCSQIGKDNLLALVPQNNGGLTTQEYPQFWFYLPFGGNSQSPPAKFRLLDEQRQSVLTKPLLFSLPEKKGIVSINLPSTEKALSVGKKYYWYFNISCVNHEGRNTNISVNGWIQRVEASSELVKKIQQPRNQQQYIPYAENNIWYETVGQLAQNRAVYQQDWTNLLSLFQLKEFANSPVYELKMKK
ncbi:DUF928 domain-containing protein [Nostoc sp. FACHB-152]|uniref:DUF928 domain-containing protein n=1 Tax=unclassified Nostoc TaxID=2593658 RepID=UPI00168A335F|nr:MULTISPECIES: DUF928 domain-containing protein [unclassified Nostoc]MBD2448593.1 DUF928 domain-containing protein [Nostoc sp. FACHB-152]MBD2469939.1 DUF928 domain-containing protein [Nostoc sp. FACHB-145]